MQIKILTKNSTITFIIFLISAMIKFMTEYFVFCLFLLSIKKLQKSI